VRREVADGLVVQVDAIVALARGPLCDRDQRIRGGGAVLPGRERERGAEQGDRGVSWANGRFRSGVG
jgi:hypothetical protein